MTDPAAGRFVTITIGGTRLALASGEVQAIDSALDLRDGAREDLACASIRIGAETCPVYALDDDLAVVSAPPAARRVCAVLEHAGRRAGVLADAVGSVEAATLRLEPLPMAVRFTGSPVSGLAVQGGELLFTSTAQRLVSWLEAGGRMPHGAAA